MCARAVRAVRARTRPRPRRPGSSGAPRGAVGGFPWGSDGNTAGTVLPAMTVVDPGRPGGPLAWGHGRRDARPPGALRSSSWWCSWPRWSGCGCGAAPGRARRSARSPHCRRCARPGGPRARGGRRHPAPRRLQLPPGGLRARRRGAPEGLARPAGDGAPGGDRGGRVGTAAGARPERGAHRGRPPARGADAARTRCRAARRSRSSGSDATTGAPCAPSRWPCRPTSRPGRTWSGSYSARRPAGELPQHGAARGGGRGRGRPRCRRSSSDRSAGPAGPIRATAST